MTADPTPDSTSPPWRRRGAVGGVVCVALLTLLALVLLSGLAVLPALLGAASIVIAALAAIWADRSRVADAVAATPPLDSLTVPWLGRGDEIAGLIAALPDPVIALNAEGRVIALNPPALVAMPALRRGEPVMLALRVPAVVDAIRRAATTGEPQRAQFGERVPLDRWFEVHVAPAAAASMRDVLLLTLHDLTALRRMEEMRADFIANASHELRTPLAALSGFIDTLQGSAREDKAAREKFLAIMKQQAGRMARLIDDLLSLSRVELNAHVPPETPLELEPIIRQVVDGLQMLAEERGVTMAIIASEPLRVRGDRDELLRVFENLVENALKYGGAGKRVEITLERVQQPARTEPEARVAVRDHGPGIAQEHLPRLTERFYRVDIGHSRAEGGTGLGLALVKHILNHHRGRLLIESTPGEGSTFTAALPLLADSAG